MLLHDVVSVNVLDVSHKVLGAWGQYDVVPMLFSGGEIGCWGGDWYVKGESVSSHSKSRYIRLFLLGPNVADDAAICDRGVLGDFVPVDEKQVLVPCMYPNPWEIRPISFDVPFLHLSFFNPLMRCQYYWTFLVLGQMNALSLPGFNVRSPVTWSMTAQSSPTGRMRGAVLLGLAGGLLIFFAWFVTSSCLWRRLFHVLYR